jgi:NMD protein affecting ribosome stability and mRNA decay
MNKFYCEECGEEITEEDEGICDECALEQYDDIEEDEE